jgi:N-acyl-D-amino-acid deacylase
MRAFGRLALVPPLLGAWLAAAPESARAPYDVVLRNGRVVDGSGAPARAAAVALKDGRIAAIGALAGAAASVEIDAEGLIVAPGFIDVHTHADELDGMPAPEHFLRMGVTTLVAGNCGGSALRVGEALARIEQARPALNFATLVGHNTVRRAVMGSERRAPKPEELQQMRELVQTAMRDGAVGFSTGLQYVPGTYAETDEIVELAKVAGAHGGLYASHLRNEGTELQKAVAEALEIGRAAACPVQISHLKVDSPRNWGASARALAMIDEAGARGFKVAADQYAYSAASSTLGIRFPAWVSEGGQTRINERLDDPQSWARIREEMVGLIGERGLRDYAFAVVASYRPDPTRNGLSIKQIAVRERGSDSLDAQLEVMREMLRAGGASMVYHFMSEDDIARIMRHPSVSFASDSSLNRIGEGVPHPRGYGNNARVLGLYVRERQTLSLEEAIRKMSSLPASQFGLAGRGVLEVGNAADLVVFDPARVSDLATYQDPHRHAAGFAHVIVNGVFVIRDGRLTGERPGSVLRGSGARHLAKPAAASAPFHSRARLNRVLLYTS